MGNRVNGAAVLVAADVGVAMGTSAVFGIRRPLQWRTTGSTGFRRLGWATGPVEWCCEPLLAVAADAWDGCAGSGGPVAVGSSRLPAWGVVEYAFCAVASAGSP